ncbi:unnamed protein product [Cyprideis torosa]|uniref:Homoserine dehydrogenase n=1 Tax=Cyprideis torosa TaxID=163714 RepID=A0A7R8ZT14_9CRUS|nr:unnamed protein product [Cyprideis torosa]CAG0907527.1 unnamed protein product [Cyprideis torosa]
MKTIDIGLIGYGTVGKGFAKAMATQQDLLKKRTGGHFVLKRIADTSAKSLPDFLQDTVLTKDAADVLNDPEIDIVVELIGGIEPAKTFLLQAIANKKHVVTANKALLSTHGDEIFAQAAAHKVEVGFEASVGGGIPVIKALKEGLTANTILSIRGIMNGTANYILSTMTEEGHAFDTVLRDAQEKGFAEADPSYDIDGIDTAHKLAILMTLAYGQKITLDHVNIEGISSIQPMDIDFARQFGYRIKLLAISHNHGNQVEARVHPTMVPENHMLAHINGAFNAIQFTGNVVGDVLLYGQGAGMMPTGSAVAADVIDIGRNMLKNAEERVPPLAVLPQHLKEAQISPMGELRCPYYFRINVVDRPGVLAKITSVFAKHKISVKSMLQKSHEQEEPVSIVVRSHKALESSVQMAIKEIDALDVCTAPTVTIRDGMGDYPMATLGGRTPLEAAHTPMMDMLCGRSKLLLSQTVPAGFPPGSDVANLSLMGYDPEIYYTGRAPLEAASMGVSLARDETAFRCNLVTLEFGESEQAKMIDFSADHISTEEAAKLIYDLQGLQADQSFQLYPGVSYRHLLIAKDPLPPLTTTPPHDHIGEDITTFRRQYLGHDRENFRPIPSGPGVKGKCQKCQVFVSNLALKAA